MPKARKKSAPATKSSLAKRGVVAKKKPAKNAAPARAAKPAPAQPGQKSSAKLLATKPAPPAAKKKLAEEIRKRLEQMLPEPRTELDHRNAFELLVATILSAQSTDRTVNRVTPALFEHYPTPAALAAADPIELENEIKATGFFRNKAKAIRAASQRIVEAYGGEVPRTMEELLTVPGAARKTANVVLGTAYGLATGVVVDTHVSRLSNRLDLSKQTTAEKIEQDLITLLPQERWISFSHQMIHHGRSLCIARKPRCSECLLDPICYAKDKTL